MVRKLWTVLTNLYLKVVNFNQDHFITTDDMVCKIFVASTVIKNNVEYNTQVDVVVSIVVN